MSRNPLNMPHHMTNPRDPYPATPESEQSATPTHFPNPPMIPNISQADDSSGSALSTISPSSFSRISNTVSLHRIRCSRSLAKPEAPSQAERVIITPWHCSVLPIYDHSTVQFHLQILLDKNGKINGRMYAERSGMEGKKVIVADRPVPADVDVVRSLVGETAFDGPTFSLDLEEGL